jgi:hypothetical protein
MLGYAFGTEVGGYPEALLRVFGAMLLRTQFEANLGLYPLSQRPHTAGHSVWLRPHKSGQRGGSMGKT